MEKNNSSPSLLYRSLSLLSTEELEEVLRTDRLMTGDEASDEEVLITITDILLERENMDADIIDEKTEASLEAFWRDAVHDEENHARAVASGRTAARPRWRIWLMGVAAILILGLPTANAFHRNLIQIVQQLIAGQFSFVSDEERQNFVDVTPFQQLLDEKQISVSLEKLWLPGKFVPKDILKNEYLTFGTYQLQLLSDKDELLVITVTYYTDQAYNKKVETSDRMKETYTTGERVFYILRNDTNLSATLFEQNFEFTVSGDISMENLHKILDSIG